jgi:hypothetical protein
MATTTNHNFDLYDIVCTGAPKDAGIGDKRTLKVLTDAEYTFNVGVGTECLAYNVGIAEARKLVKQHCKVTCTVARLDAAVHCFLEDRMGEDFEQLVATANELDMAEYLEQPLMLREAQTDTFMGLPNTNERGVRDDDWLADSYGPVLIANARKHSRSSFKGRAGRVAFHKALHGDVSMGYNFYAVHGLL